MKGNETMKTTTNIICPTLALFAFVCVAISPQARAVCQEGCLTNRNTVLGDDALLNNTTGFDNTATGASALFNNTTGFQNTAVGADALVVNTNGGDNTAVGDGALASATTSDNTATGAFALTTNSTGFHNTADGSLALQDNMTGSNNVALGFEAGQNLTTGNFNIDIGSNVRGLAEETNTIRIGKSGTQTKTFVAGIRGAMVASGVGVIVGPTGQLGTLVSSARFKEAIKPMDKASEAILALKPVTFRYKEELDPDHVPQFGLIAEEVEKVSPNLVARDEEGKIMSVRYEAVNAMLLNEFLKEHRKVQQLEATVAQQRKDFDAAIAQVKAQVQKMSAQLELNQPAPQTVLNNQ